MTPAAVPEAIWHSLGWAMLHFLWLGALVGVVFFGLERLLMRRAAAVVRYAHGVVCLIALVVTAGLCVWHELPAAQFEGGAPAPAVAVLPPGPAAAPAVFPRASYPAVAADPVDDGVMAEPSSEFVWVAALPWIWIAGSNLLATSLALGLTGTWRLRRGVDLTAGGAIRGHCEALRARLGIATRVAVGICDRVGAPLLIGVFRPLIVLPISALGGMSPAMLEWVLLHELAHVRRRDNVVIMFQRLVECLLFFHPCVWLASRWVDREREFCCDAFALANNRDCDPIGYAQTLATLAGVPNITLVPASAMANGAVVQRIRRIVDDHHHRARSGGGALLGVLLGSLLSAALFAWALAASAAQPQQELGPGSDADGGAIEVEAELEPIEAVEVGADDPHPDQAPAPNFAPLPSVTEADASPGAGTVAKAHGQGFVSRVYRVPPNFLSQLPGKGSLQSRLEAKGIEFPEGTVAMFEPVRSLLVLNHTEDAVLQIGALIQPHISNPDPQVLLKSTIQLRRGGAQEKLTTPPSLVTSSGSSAKIEIIRELIYPVNAPGKAAAFEMTPVGLEIGFDPISSKASLDVEVSGYVQIRLVKGTDVDGFFQKPQNFGPVGALDHQPEFDVYRKPFKQTIRHGQSIDLPLGEVPGRRALLKRNRLEPGSLSATLSVRLIDPSGAPLDTKEKLRNAYPPFRLQAVDLVAGELAFSAALAAYDLGNFALAESSARSALASAPGDLGRQALWEQTKLAAATVDHPVKVASGAWADRSYRLRVPLLPADCRNDPAALHAFLESCGMGMPTGANAEVAEDGYTLNIHNRGREIAKLESALAERVSQLVGGVALVSAEVFQGAPALQVLLEGGVLKEREWDWIAPASLKPAPGTMGIAGIFTDPQYRALRRAAEKQARITTLPDRGVASGKLIDVLEGSPLKFLKCDLDLTVDRDGSTIDATLAPEVVERDEAGKTVFSSRKQSTTVTVWDGQWIALAVNKDEGKNDYVFVRLRVGKL